VTVHNSTIAFNNARNTLGAIGGDGGALTVLTGTGSLGEGGGVTVYGAGTLRAVSSIFADNFGASGQDVVGNFSLADHILLGNNTGSNLAGGNPDANGNLVGTPAAPVDPTLGPLQDNGGPTETMALQPGSPAINRGSNPDGLTTDQRGFGPRDAGGGVDIGAFQLGATPVGSSPPPAPVVHGVTTRVIKVKRHQLLEVFDAQTGAFRFTVYPFGSGFRGNFSVTTANVNGDGFADVLVTTTIRQGRRHVVPVTVIFSGLDGSRLE
jgi:hypothetical protein